MEKYLIMVNEITSRKKLSQKEIEQNRFKQFESTTIYETNNKTEAEEILKRFINFKKYKKYYYDVYYKNYTYKRFELVKEIINDKDPKYTTYEDLGIFYPNYDEEEDEEDE